MPGVNLWCPNVVCISSPIIAEEDTFLNLLVHEHGAGEWGRRAAQINAFLAGTKKNTRRTADECYGRCEKYSQLC